MIPTNEQGVVVLFAQQAEEAGFEIVSIQQVFPDAIVKKDGKEYRAEFEFKASGFVVHKHDPRECDLIICWENDLADYPLPVIAISDSDWGTREIVFSPKAEKEAVYWKDRALTAERALNSEDGIQRSGRPRGVILPGRLAYYLKRGPSDVTIREAKERLSIARYAHAAYKDFAVALVESLGDIGVTIEFYDTETE